MGVGLYELGHEDGCHGAQEDGVTAEESKELRGRCEDFPLWLCLAGKEMKALL